MQAAQTLLISRRPKAPRLTRNQRLGAKTKPAQIRYQKRKLSGMCVRNGCSSKRERDRLHCREHLDLMSTVQRQRSLSRKEKGLCVNCGVRLQFWGVRCVVCRQRYTKNAHPLPLGARRALKHFREAERKMEIEQRQIAARCVIRKLLATGDIVGDSATALRLYAGIDNGQWRNGVEVARLMHISKERVRQLLYPSKVVVGKTLGRTVPWKPLRIKAARTAAEKSWKQPKWFQSWEDIRKSA